MKKWKRRGEKRKRKEETIEQSKENIEGFATGFKRITRRKGVKMDCWIFFYCSFDFDSIFIYILMN